jgi:hypothetical protein
VSPCVLRNDIILVTPGISLLIHGSSVSVTWNLCPGRTGGELQMNRLSSRTNRLKLKTSGNLPMLVFFEEESIQECTSNEWKQNRKMSTCNRLDVGLLGSWSSMPKNFPGIAWNHGCCSYISSMAWNHYKHISLRKIHLHHWKTWAMRCISFANLT